jgi:ABC-type antimicrobial peptide transport system permease subunit
LPVDQVTKSMRQALASVDPALPLSSVTTMRSVLDGSVAQPRFSMLMLMICAGLAVVLAAVGIYGVISYNVSQRLAEIGVRVALGATRGDVLRLVIGQAMRITTVGLAIGLGIALGTGRVLANQLYEVKPGDPLVLAGVTVFLALVALLAAALPALRATQVAPTMAIRGNT